MVGRPPGGGRVLAHRGLAAVGAVDADRLVPRQSELVELLERQQRAASLMALAG